MHFLQIWILPERSGLEPGYQQEHFGAAAIEGGLRLVASREGRDGSVTIHQDVDLYAARLAEDDAVQFALRQDRRAWLHVARGSIEFNDQPMTAGDGAAIESETALSIRSLTNDAEILLFDMS